MIKFNVINKRISVFLLSGVILCSYGCNMKTNSDESVESSIIDEHSLDSDFDTTSESGKVIVSNIDISTNNEISGTKLSIINEQGYGIKKWITTNEIKEIELNQGRYQLIVEEETNYYNALVDYVWFNIENGKETKITIKNKLMKNIEDVSYDTSYIDIIDESSIIESSVEINSKVESYQQEDNENKVIKFFETIDDKITSMSYTIKDELIKDYKTIYDFIFNEGTIKGYTFNELKDNTKAKAMDLYLKIDDKIESKYPNYKDTIKEKFGNTRIKVKDKLLSFSTKLKEYIKDEIGEEEYQDIIDTKDKYVQGFKEQTVSDVSDLKELGGIIKDKVKSYIKNKN